MRLYMYHAAFVVCQKARLNNLFIKEIHNFTFKKNEKTSAYIYFSANKTENINKIKDIT